ncbi:MAG TPA: trimethylamine methyltransferase family protein, partial [Spirochaetota bacterium]|nr:trimethylamine methyltransferase family protein [Spirochaetota bacterium]
LSREQVESIHHTSMTLLSDPGVECYNEKAVAILQQAGCSVQDVAGADSFCKQVQIPAGVVQKALKTVPQRIIMGARDPAKKLLLDAERPSVYFGTGSETNIFLETHLKEYTCRDNPDDRVSLPVYEKKRGSVKRLCQSAKLCNALENVDFFIRNVNLQDEAINYENKDVNVFFAALMYMTKHVQAGLVNIAKLQDVLKLGKIIAGGEEAFKDNPLLSFITCIIKSPLQMVDDTTAKLIAVARENVPVVLSSSPQGGSTAPVREEGIVAMINAEILTGIVIAQLVNPGTPVLYGAVPVRARMDNLHDLYGAPEFIHYNQDCAQMAAHYNIPCYSSCGVGDAKVPGLQATIEKVFSQLEVARGGAQYIHYAFGLLEKTNRFCPLQAVLDNEHISIIKNILRRAEFDRNDTEAALKEIKQVCASPTRLFARYMRKAYRQGLVSPDYAFAATGEEDRVIYKAWQRLQQILNGDSERLSEEIIQRIYKEVPGLLAKDFFNI